MGLALAMATLVWGSDGIVPPTLGSAVDRLNFTFVQSSPEFCEMSPKYESCLHLRKNLNIKVNIYFLTSKMKYTKKNLIKD